MNRLFETTKVGCFVDKYAPAVEKRKSGETTVLQVHLRVQPFDAALASSLDNGVGGDSNIRATIFNLNSGEPRKRFTRHDFKLEIERQTLELYASPDTELCRIALSQAKITGCYVRTEKDINALAFCFKAVFGPVGRDELEIVHALHRLQTFITFVESEPLLDEEEDPFDDGDEDLSDADEKARHNLQQPEFDDPRDEQPATAATDEPSQATKDAQRTPGVNRPLHSHQSKKGRGKKR